MTEQPEHETFKPVFGGASEPRHTASAPATSTATNPWLSALVIGGSLALFAGIIAYATGFDSATSTSLFDDSDPAGGLAAMFAGEMLIIGGALLIALWLTASAICWQLARKQP